MVALLLVVLAAANAAHSITAAACRRVLRVESLREDEGKAVVSWHAFVYAIALGLAVAIPFLAQPVHPAIRSHVSHPRQHFASVRQPLALAQQEHQVGEVSQLHG